MSAPASQEVLRFEGVVERKRPGLPRFVVAPSATLAPWNLTETTVVEVVLDGMGVGRRSLKRWDERNGWFFDLTEKQCAAADVETGDAVSVELRRASMAPPVELRALIEAEPEARKAWDSLSDSRRRMLAEHVRAAKRDETRRRRAARALGVEP